MKRKLAQSVATAASNGVNRLGTAFFDKGSIDLSRALLGKVMARRLENGDIIRGTIVETEAYPGSVEAEEVKVHCFITKQTEKNTGLFMDPGTTWVYMTYGVFNMMNISAKGDGSASLIRAIEPKENYDSMHQFRNQRKKKKTAEPPSPLAASSRGRGRRSNANEAEPEIAQELDENESKLKPKKALRLHELCNGPGKLCKAFDIRKDSHDQLDLITSDDLWLEENDDPLYHDDALSIVEATRIGIDSAPENSRKDLLRFYIRDNFSVSTMKPGEIRKKMKEREEELATFTEAEAIPGNSE